MPAAAEYLTKGAEAQLGGRFAEHTPHDVNERIELPLVVNGHDATLVVPDRPGEDWRKFYGERRFPADWIELVGHGTSWLIFVRAGGFEHALDWYSVQKYRGASANFVGPRATTPEVPTQVVLVDWLQLIERLSHARTSPSVRPRIGIVISAWDSLGADQQEAGPMDYLSSEAKLLHDFMICNTGRFDMAAFGTSLYGGDLKDADFVTRFRTEGNPKGRGYVWAEHNGALTRYADLAFPAAWALGATE